LHDLAGGIDKDWLHEPTQQSPATVFVGRVVFAKINYLDAL
jgi:hypothetical protein